jgi:hypothetical protein
MRDRLADFDWGLEVTTNFGYWSAEWERTRYGNKTPNAGARSAPHTQEVVVHQQPPSAPTQGTKLSKSEKKAQKRLKEKNTPAAPPAVEPVVLGGETSSKKVCLYDLRHHYSIRDNEGAAFPVCSKHPCSKMHFEEAKKKKISKASLEKQIKEVSNGRFTFVGADEMVTKVQSDPSFK